MDSLIRKGGDVCDELRIGIVDLCILHKVRWRRECSKILGNEGKEIKLW